MDARTDITFNHLNIIGRQLLTSSFEPAINAVKNTSQFVADQAEHVHINQKAINKAVNDLTIEKLAELASPTAYNKDLHYVDGGPLTVQYLLVVDALNFCFWPDEELEYEHLSKGVKAAVESDPTCLDAEKLLWSTGADVRRLMGCWGREVPLEEERARLLREVGSTLLQHFGGQAAKMVEAAGGSALGLVQLVAQLFPGFRDHAVYRGRQVFLYKRAQIFVGDVYGAFGGEGLGAFCDIDQLTMFADYRVPVVLRNMGILSYSEELAAKVERREVIPAGSPEEVEIRACTVAAVERLREAIAHKFLGTGAQLPHAIQLDWWLWEIGERDRATHPPHHRTLTIFY
ncbi:hypothetical protein VOLCADRAFT_120119 [Volvox carteri f. nagariensis]|uniref:Queuosine 5'-phosphate N-glycosylase/hydrolase n=1 Tax=Volvox carteri f. nagariensis TaxID=3068 RepID=D8UKR2_VOLCA|nr:uncharacterized protein VOLCADRAFT_120119 [Volvox carteri f. nagariensis]EFJ39686.1 hypothetical protein VOLCADRAFT_120119 [Volvox carteri f. nagariensis]|eukprot:XP_002959244.1 hypothetical protein VOLCADRAFT_120119 [Volvox carteri f. nagariensis]